MIDSEPFLRATPVVDWEQPAVAAVARDLARGRSATVAIVQACFEWVRDEVLHTVDHGLDPVTCTASEVLKERTGFCYAKSHLLAGLLRANGIPTGFVYQRLAREDRTRGFCLHGLNAVWLADIGWYRIDPRGNRADIQAGFDPPRELLPYPCRIAGERLFPGVWADPLPVVVQALRRSATRADLVASLPDATDPEPKPDAMVAAAE